MAGKLVEKTGASSSSSNSIAQKNIEIPKNVKNITKDRIVTPRMVVDDIGYIENELSNTLSQSKLMDSKRLTSTPKKNLNKSSVEESPRLQQPAKRSSRIAEQDAKANGRSPFSSPDPATIIGKRKSLSPVPFPVNGPPILCREQHLSFEVLSGERMYHYYLSLILFLHLRLPSTLVLPLPLPHFTFYDLRSLILSFPTPYSPSSSFSPSRSLLLPSNICLEGYNKYYCVFRSRH